MSVNVITGSKALAERLAMFSFPGKIVDVPVNIIKDDSLDHVNLLTADTEVPYKENQNNIGTTFKTGVDIKNENEILFIIFPTVKNTPKFSHYGIFSDGLSSIIQSIGRIRNGGDIHLFINEPEICIGNSALYPSMFHTKDFQNHLSVNDSYEQIKNKYNDEVTKSEAEINQMESSIKGSIENKVIDYKREFGFWYPNIHEYLLEYSKKITINHENVSFGKLLAPYVLWACLNDQFINANLKKIVYYGGNTIVKINNKNAVLKFTAILKTHEADIKAQGFRTCLNNLKYYIGYKINDIGDKDVIQYKINAQPSISASEIINKKIGLTAKATSVLFFLSSNNKFDFENIESKREYLNACIFSAENLTDQSLATELHTLYLEFGKIKSKFYTLYAANIIIDGTNRFFPKNGYTIIDDNFVNNIIDVVNKLKKKDIVISSRVISFLQHLNPKSIDDSKYSIFKELEKLSFSVTSKTKQIKGKTHVLIKELAPSKKLEFLV